MKTITYDTTPSIEPSLREKKSLKNHALRRVITLELELTFRTLQLWDLNS